MPVKELLEVYKHVQNILHCLDWLYCTPTHRKQKYRNTLEKEVQPSYPPYTLSWTFDRYAVSLIASTNRMFSFVSRSKCCGHNLLRHNYCGTVLCWEGHGGVTRRA